jgi:hypothetical protein
MEPVSEQQMSPDDLEIQLERLQHSKGPAYRDALARLLAAYGRDAIVKSLVESCTGNIVSIAASPNWCTREPNPIAPPCEFGWGHFLSADLNQ